jgi:predicted porin
VKNKKVLFAAIAAFSAPVFADSANVTVYGKADVSYDSIKTGTAANGTNGVTSNRVASNSTYLGFKGSEDLGDGLSAIWQVESVINAGDAALNGAGTSGGTFATRNTFIGLKNDSYGTALAGRHDTPYKLATRRLDQFSDGIADNRSLMGSGVAQFDNRQDQVLAYISPSLGGVTIAAAHVNLVPTQATVGLNSNATSVAAWYDANGFYAAAAYELHNNMTSTFIGATNEKAAKVGLGYTQEGVFSVGIAAEKTSDNEAGGATASSTSNVGGTPVPVGGNLDGHKALYISGKIYVNGSDAIKAAYTSLGNVTGTSNSGAKQISVGYDHALGKRATVYALYTKLKNGAAASYSLSSAATVGGASTIAGAGAAPSAVAVGMKVSF